MPIILVDRNSLLNKTGLNHISMLESKRKFKRFHIPIGVKFRPTYGAKEFSSAISTDISCEGIGIDAHDFRFFVHENLELLIETPGTTDPVALFGDVLWKKQSGKRCIAGVNLSMADRQMQAEAIERLFSSLKIPLKDLYSNDLGDEVIETYDGRSRPDIVLNDIPNKLGFIKRYNEERTKCTVTFRLLKETAGIADSVNIVGDFNEWDATISPMTRLDNGDYVITIELDSNRDYRFRYLIDGHRWENDWYAGKFIRNDFGSKDSVIVV